VAEAGVDAVDEGGEILLGVELHPEEARVPEHDHEGVADAPTEAAVGVVDLGLKGQRRLQPHHGWRRRSVASNVGAELGQARYSRRRGTPRTIGRR
jgi:hypothetical protein